MLGHNLRGRVSVIGVVLTLLVGAARAQSGDGNTAGVGIAFRPNDDGELVVAAILPHGPADRVGLKPGGVLVAIDGQEVDGLSPEQVRTRLSGKPGTRVTVTIETDTAVQDVVIERAVLPAAGQSPQVQQKQAVAPDPPPGNPLDAAPPTGIPVAPGNPLPPAGLGGGQFPAWMKPGVRVTWYVGSASIPGMSSAAVQDDNGNWIDPQTGQRYANVDNPSTGGAGYLQQDILQASDNFIATSARNWLMLDTNGVLTSGPITGYVGDAQALGDFWIHPAKLAAMQEQDQGGLRIRRLVYPLNGRNFNAIAIQSTAGGGFTRTTYDLETGLLLVGSGRTVGKAQQQIQPDGKVWTGGGVTTITSTVLQDVREMKLPWATDPAPAFVRDGWQLQYAGTQQTAIPGTEGLNIPASQLVIEAATRQVGRFAVAMNVRSSLQMPYSQPQQGEVLRCYGSGMVGGLWMNPQSIQRLGPGEVVDEDRITRVRTTFQGVQNNLAVIAEQGVNDASSYYYDLQSGMLVGVTAQQKSGVATITTQVQLRGQR